MKIKLVALVAVAFVVCGAVVYVYASSDVSSTEPSISSTPESTPLACGNGGCAKKAECDKPAEKEDCPKSGSCDKSKEDCPKSGSCDKSKEDCPKSGSCDKSKEGCSKS